MLEQTCSISLADEEVALLQVEFIHGSSISLLRIYFLFLLSSEVSS